MRYLAQTLLFCLSLLVTQLVQADERILSYHSAIQVLQDGSMSVTETIQVKAEGNKIKRGIYRDFPTIYQDRIGNRYSVGFELLGTTREGQVEPHHIKNLSNGVRIYLGSKDVLLRAGVYTYSLSYRTSRQLGFFAQHDELYWNVTGTDWDFPINQVSASVSLPRGIEPNQIVLEGYTGPAGAKGQNYSASVDENAVSQFISTRPLQRHEGLTIVVSWPKGHVHQPDLQEEIAYQLEDNAHLLAAGAAILILIIYYLLAWLRVGRDPQAGVIITRYEPASGFSPASMRYISRMGHDDKAFASALISLAVKGYLHISEKNKVYSLKKLAPAEKAPMAAGEKALFASLFRNGTSITLKNTNHRTIQAAKKAHEESLSNNYERQYFNTNSGWMLPGLFITVAMLVVTILMLPSGESREVLMFMTVWLSIWSIGTSALVMRAVNAWRAALHNGFAGILGAVAITAFSIPFVGGFCVGLWMVAENSSWLTVALLVVALSINLIFYILLRAPTRAGRQLLDSIEGFKDYLQVAEKDELNFKHPAGKSIETFERFLPFALALDVEQAWAEEFSGVLATTLVENGSHYHPRWYSGHHWNIHQPASFSQHLGSALSSSIASSSSAPGSSSGSGGGGSSGGGGGGGGGGGW